jgi:NitT/TauT family transport system permease protein
MITPKRLGALARGVLTLAAAVVVWEVAARTVITNRLVFVPPSAVAVALPSIVAGVRVGVSRGVVAVVAAELFGARAGLGFLILACGQTFDTATLFAAVVLLAVAGAALVELVKLLERRLAPWRDSYGSPSESRGEA